ncbi:tetratricopeptide repeat protein [Pedomonas mirosovicensis]|uniref:tetratricopeptide repeat protein n=1 Tax=Pedomonas mirosovicensis TaxID=2908641 RepID=UPI002166F975|nr:tetratricopeptide repeat protein [Pedomonas mirosovicensis]MCH8683741.1 tetratricopeptide repeat protein [Pedomonas mirosovicensis]
MATQLAPSHDVPLTSNEALCLQRALQALQGGHAAQACDLCRQVLATKPFQPDAQHLLGLALKALGDREGAVTALRTSLQVRPRQPQLLNNLGNLLDSMGRTDEALAAYRQALTLDSGFVEAWINLGLTANSAGLATEAIAALERARDLSPNSAKAWAALGGAYRRAGRLEDAIAAYRKATQLEPRQARTWVNLGVALRMNGEPEDALACFDAAERAGFSGPELTDGRASALLDLGRTRDGIEFYRRLTKTAPDYAMGHVTLAKLIWEQKLEEEPTATIRKALGRARADVGLWRALFQILMPLKRWDEMVTAATDARRVLGDLPFLSHAEAMARSERGDGAAATALFETLIAAQPSDAMARSDFARHLLRQQMPDAAARQAEEAARLDPDSQFAFAYLGTAWRMLDDPREHWLHDYDRLVMPLAVEPPEGVDDIATFARQLEAALLPLHRSAQHPLDQTLRGGTQTAGALFVSKDPVIQSARRQIEKAIADYVRRLPDDETHPLLRRKAERVRFSGSWSVRLRGNGSHHINHMHSEGWISSAFYVQLPACVHANGGNDMAGWIQFGAPPVELGLDLPPRRVIRPEVGRLVLFPSYTWHGTIPFEDDDTRTTIAFDAVPAA